MTSGARTVEDLMSKKVLTVGRNDRLARADDLMEKKRLRHLVVLDENDEVSGVVSHRDISRGALVRALGFGGAAEQRLLEDLRVKEVMSEEPETIEAKASLAEAARLMRSRGIGCLPVMQDGRLVGILTESDFLALAAPTDKA